MAYDGALSSDDAVAAMCKEVPFFGETSHKLMVILFASMMEGTKLHPPGAIQKQRFTSSSISDGTMAKIAWSMP